MALFGHCVRAGKGWRMPVSNVQRLQALSQHLALATSSQDWGRLQELERMVADCLDKLPQQLSAEALVAWQQLTAVHTQAHQACAAALQETGARLRDLQDQSEAHKAYAWQEQF